MDLGHIDESDRKVLYVLGAIALVLTVGLTVTGVWQFLYHEPNPALSGYLIELENRVSTAESSGVAWVHGTLGDLAAILTLFGGAWFMMRVSYRFSRLAAFSLLVLISALLTGGVIRFGATVHDGVVDVTTEGYAQFFTGDADLAVTDRSTFSGTWMAFWTTVHIVSLPAIVGGAIVTFREMLRRRQAEKTAGPAWRKT